MCARALTWKNIPPAALFTLHKCMQGSYLDQPQFGSVPSQAITAKPEADILLELRNVHKAFGEKKVLRGCNITIKRGEAVGIIGSSGSGKSTTLRLMAGLVAPDWVRTCRFAAQCDYQAEHARSGFSDEGFTCIACCTCHVHFCLAGCVCAGCACFRQVGSQALFRTESIICRFSQLEACG